MNEIKEIRLHIAASIYMCPCTESELKERDFCKNMSLENLQRIIFHLEKDAIYYKGDVMYINKEWAKKNLTEYDLDFRTEREKYLDSLTSFAREVLKNNP